MVQIIDTSTLQPGSLPATHSHWIYNGLDCCVTHEVEEVIHAQVDETNQRTYDFERTQQAPALYMMLRGTLIDMDERETAIKGLTTQIERLTHILNLLAIAAWDRGLNPQSPKQLKDFFYEHMGLPKQYISDKGERKVSTNRESLEKLTGYFYAQPFIGLILKARELKDLRATLRSGVDPDNRMRTSNNIGATYTGRWSTSKNAFGTGTNLQSITEQLRRIFVADVGYKMSGPDLEQSEARHIAYLSQDENYIAAVEGGDLHSDVARMIWPHINDVHALFYRHFSYRDLAKRGGHLCNYVGTAWTMARHLKIPQSTAEEFQHLYFSRFPGIRQYHKDVARRVQLDGYLTTPMGRRIWFLGRPWDDKTVRDAVAAVPQSLTADTLNEGMCNIWNRHRYAVQMLLQIHDQIVNQYREENEDELVPKIKACLEFPIEINGRTCLVPAEMKTGWNWGKFNDDPKKGLINLDGLRKYKGSEDRCRRKIPPLSILDRVVC
jgi:DNA polymerase-1